MLLWQILLLPMENIYKCIVMKRLIEYHHSDQSSMIYAASGPVALMYEAAKTINVHTTVVRSIRDGVYMHKAQWKALVKNNIQIRENSLFLASCLLYPRLNLYRSICIDICMWPWWGYCLMNPRDTPKCRTMLRLVVGESSLNRSLDGNEVVVRPICELCGVGSPLTPHHVLFNCDMLREIRTPLLYNVANSAPSALWECMESMSSVNKTEFILSGFRCKYMHEWYELYQQVLNFVVSMLNCSLLKLRNLVN